MYGLKQHPQVIKTITSMGIIVIIRMHKIVFGKKWITKSVALLQTD